MNSVWQRVALGEVCEFVRGPFGGALKKSIFKESGYAVYEQRNAIYNQFTDIRYFVDEQKFSEMRRFELRPNDLIMSCSGTMGKIAIVPEDHQQGIINQALLKLTVSDKLTARYLHAWMESPDFQDQLKGLTVGAAIKNVASVKNLKQIQIPLPPIKEQKRIVAVLDAAFEGLDRARAHTESNLQNARELFQSALNQTFSTPQWDSEISVAKSYLKTKVPNKIPRKKYLNEGPFPIVSQEKNLVSGKWNLESDVVRLERPIIVFGDHTRILKYIDFDFVVGADGTQLLRPIDSIYPLFYYYALRTIDLEGKGYARHFSHLKKETFAFPSSTKTQISISSRLRKLEEFIEQARTQYKSKISDLSDLRQSLLQKAFAGELT